MLIAGAAARLMVRTKTRGALLFITSIHGRQANTNDFFYGGMKAAIERSCQSLAIELAPYGIRANCIAPGAINVRGADDTKLKYPYANLIPAGRRGEPEDIAHAAAFLLSDQANYITGQSLCIDGGMALPGQPEGWAEPHPVDFGFVKAAYEQYSRRIPTGVLNEALADAQASLQPPVSGGRRLKIYYATQQSTCPPTFVFFVNSEELMHFAYERYLENHLRKSFGFEGTPVRFILREKTKD